MTFTANPSSTSEYSMTVSRAGTAEIIPVSGTGSQKQEPAEVLDCLQQVHPRLPAWFGYDAVGSRLFEQITTLPNYYLTRVERGLLRRNASEIAALSGETIAELGSGDADKTRLLLASCHGLRRTAYVPVDISKEALDAATTTVASELPGIAITGLWGHYEAGLDWVRAHASGTTTLALLGANLGNTTMSERNALLRRIAHTLRSDDNLLVSADLRKPTHEFHDAYNDPPGRTAFADFRLNYLTQLNQRFGSDFDLDHFRPRAHYDPETGIVEGNLYPLRDQTVPIPKLGHTLDLNAGEPLNVGYSAKFDREQLVSEAAGHGFDLRAEWVDPQWQYGIFLFHRRTHNKEAR